jgi:anti-anti-sigma factor
MSVETHPVVVRPEGEIDLATAHDMEARIVAAGEGGAPVVVDLSGVTFMDSSGVRGLVRADAVVDLSITNVPPALERVLDLTALSDHFHRI